MDSGGLAAFRSEVDGDRVRTQFDVDETFLIVDGTIRHINAQMRPFIQKT